MKKPVELSLTLTDGLIDLRRTALINARDTEMESKREGWPPKKKTCVPQIFCAFLSHPVSRFRDAGIKNESCEDENIAFEKSGTF